MPVTGKVIDGEQGFPLEFAPISRLSPADSTLLGEVTTDLEGRFEMMVETGEFILRFDYLGYQTRYRNITIYNNPIALGKIRLQADGEALDEVMIVAATRLFQSDIDKRTYNVANNVLSEGTTASDLLNTLPSFQIDKEGGISMRGSGNVLIYINGRPTNMGRMDYNINDDITWGVYGQFNHSSRDRLRIYN